MIRRETIEERERNGIGTVDRNERVFVMIRDTVGVIGEDDLQFIREIKVKLEIL